MAPEDAQTKVSQPHRSHRCERLPGAPATRLDRQVVHAQSKGGRDKALGSRTGAERSARGHIHEGDQPEKVHDNRTAAGATLRAAVHREQPLSAAQEPQHQAESALPAVRAQHHQARVQSHFDQVPHPTICQLPHSRGARYSGGCTGCARWPEESHAVLRAAQVFESHNQRHDSHHSGAAHGRRGGAADRGDAPTGGGEEAGGSYRSRRWWKSEQQFECVFVSTADLPERRSTRSRAANECENYPARLFVCRQLPRRVGGV